MTSIGLGKVGDIVVYVGRYGVPWGWLYVLVDTVRTSYISREGRDAIGNLLVNIPNVVEPSLTV